MIIIDGNMLCAVGKDELQFQCEPYSNSFGNKLLILDTSITYNHLWNNCVLRINFRFMLNAIESIFFRYVIYPCDP